MLPVVPERQLDFPVAISFYRDLDRLDRAGTLAPLRLALLNPIAIACLRFFTGCLPERMWCISVRTSFCALRPYFRPREREVERWERELRAEAPRELLREDERLDLAVERCERELRRLELRLFAIVTPPPIRRKARATGWHRNVTTVSESTLRAENLRACRSRECF